MRVYGVTPDAQRADREAITAMLDRVDGSIAAGTINGSELNAADFQIVTSLALADYVAELRPELRSRPLIGLLDRVLPSPLRPGLSEPARGRLRRPGPTGSRAAGGGRA